MTIKNLKTEIQSYLEQIKSDGDVPLKDILTAPADQNTDFSGFPSVSHMYTNMESDYATVSQNRRVVEWTLLVYHLSTTSLTDGYDDIYGYMDTLIQKFDETQDLNGACVELRPVPGSLDAASTDRGHQLVGEIRLMCEDDVNILPN